MTRLHNHLSQVAPLLARARKPAKRPVTRAQKLAQPQKESRA
jgi:hypothetical protein